MVEFDVSTVLVGWAGGGWWFLWVTTRRREVGLGYGWLVRSVLLSLAATALLLDVLRTSSWTAEPFVTARSVATVGLLAAGVVALAQSVLRRSARVAGQRGQEQRKKARVAAMTRMVRQPTCAAEDRVEHQPARASDFGLTRVVEDQPAEFAPEPAEPVNNSIRRTQVELQPAEFSPRLDLLAATLGLVAAVLGAVAADGPVGLAVARTLVGALFVGAVADSMLLGHWYLVQPGLARGPLLELVRAAGVMWLPETLVLLWPTGMVSVLNGTIDDGYNGLLGWFWLGCTVTTIGLVVVARASLKERQYSAVMAATGLMYLAILTAAGQDLVARILLAPGST